MKKLTLSADDEVIDLAKRLAQRHRTSVSGMFSRFILALSRREKAEGVPPGSIAARAAGTVRLPKGKSTRDVLTDALLDKYGAGR